MRANQSRQAERKENSTVSTEGGVTLLLIHEQRAIKSATIFAVSATGIYF